MDGRQVVYILIFLFSSRHQILSRNRHRLKPKIKKKIEIKHKKHRLKSSPLGEHLHINRDDFSQDNVNIFDHEDQWFQRGVKEAFILLLLNLPLTREPPTAGNVHQSHLVT